MPPRSRSIAARSWRARAGRVFAIGGFAAGLLACLAAATSADADDAAVLDGRCDYSPEVARHGDTTTLIVCDTFAIRRDGASEAFVFGRRDYGPAARFVGVPSAEGIIVSALVLKDGEQRAATGTCRRYARSDGSLSAMGCLAKMGQRWVAANFVPSRF